MRNDSVSITHQINIPIKVIQLNFCEALVAFHEPNTKVIPYNASIMDLMIKIIYYYS